MKYNVYLYVAGRVMRKVEASNESEAENLVLNEFDFDKILDLDIEVEEA